MEAAKAASLKNEIRNLDEKIENLKSSSLAEANLLQHVNVLLVQCTNIFKKIDTAISAASTLATCFAQHADGYQLIRSGLKGLSEGSTFDTAVLRQKFVEKKRAQFTDDVTKVCSWALTLYTSLDFHGNWLINVLYSSKPSLGVSRRYIFLDKNVHGYNVGVLPDEDINEA